MVKMSLEDFSSVFQQQILASRKELVLESQSGTTGEDRISGLPHTVLCHILSFISSTKDVTRTSVLSTKWKHIWVHVPNLYLNDGEFSSSADFIAFVDRVLHVRDSSAIRRLHLHFNSCRAGDFSLVNGWISTAVRCNVVELDLSVGIAAFELPISLLTCKTLKVLSLRSNIRIIMPTSECYCFQRLEFLHIHFTKEVSCPNISMYMSHLPVLEYLSIDGDLRYNVLHFSISAPELKTFTLNLCSNDLQHYCNFSIDAPKLGKVNYHEEGVWSASDIDLQNANSIVEANISFRAHCYVPQHTIYYVNKFLATISKVKYLSLSDSVGMAFSYPTFDNLTKLKMCHRGGSFWCRMLMKVLERSPILECLEIEDDGYPTRGWIEAEAVSIAAEVRNQIIEGSPVRIATLIEYTLFADNINWVPPESVPDCVSSRLKTIYLKGLTTRFGCFGYVDEMEMIKYLLNNSLVLENMTIYTPGLYRLYPPVHGGNTRCTTREMCDEISKFHLGSRTAQVQVVEKMFFNA